MPYILINKKTEAVRLLGSLPVVSEVTGLDLNHLQNVFGRYKKRELSTEEIRLVRVELERSERK